MFEIIRNIEQLNMSKRLNTYKNIAFAGLAIAAGSAAKFFLPSGDIGTNISNLLSNLFISIGGDSVAVEMDRLNFFKLREFKTNHPDSLNHDVLDLSKAALDLSITEGIGKPYKKKIKELGKITKDIEKQIDEQIKILESDAKSWKFSDNDAIRFVDFKDNSLELLAAETVLKLEPICEELPFNDYFKTNFPRVYQIYFGELLKKPEYNKALIAYQRQVQNLLMEAIHQKNNGLTNEEIEKISEKINTIASKDITNAIDEINKSLQDINNQLGEIQDTIKKYFESKKFIIREVNTERLIIEIPPNNVMSVANSYAALNAIIEDNYYYFEHNNRLYSVDELTEETFDYLTGKIKYNQLFTKRIIEVIKSDCEQQYPEFYNRIKNKALSWDTTSLCEEGQEKISENFAGIIGAQLYELFGIGKEQSTEKNVKYIKKCRYIVKRTLDLIIFAFKSKLWDDLCSKKVKLSDGNSLNDYFPIEEKHITLLRNLIRIYSEQKIDDTVLLIPDIIHIADQFDENGELYIAYSQLEKLGNNPTILDCYFAEKHLITFFEYFSFLVSYKLVSMKKIECFNIKNIGTDYLHHHDNLGLGDDKKATEEKIQKRNYHICCEKVNSMFTYALLLYKGDDYTQNINLFPFVIDINALNFEPISRIAFFRKSVLDKPRLQYAYLLTGKGKDDNKYFELEYKGIVSQKEKNDVIFLTDDEMKIYNKDCVYTTFKKIEKQLFI